MKLHTRLHSSDIGRALARVHDLGLVARDVTFVEFTYQDSRSHPSGFKIQLGTYDKYTGPTGSRRYKNTGHLGASSAWNGEPVWAATYDEWGWFIAEIFLADPRAKFGPYKDATDFHRQTKGAYRPSATPAVRYQTYAEAALVAAPTIEEPEPGFRLWVNTLHP